MAHPPSCTLAGFPCLLRNTIQWSFRAGTKPFQTTLELTPADAKAVVGIGGPMGLRIVSDQGELFVKHLWALRLAESDDPQIGRVVVSDRRWIWEYGHIARRFNMRRRIGTRRTKPSAHDVVELTDLLDEIAYAPYSLKDSAGTKWLAGDALANVLTEVRNFDAKKSGTKFKVIYDGGVQGRLKDLPVENLEIDDDGGAAVDRMLRYLPQLGLYLDAEGDVHVYERAGGGEAGPIANVAGGPAASVFGSHVDFADYENTRPSEIHVLFTREMEVRHDYREPTDRDTVAKPVDRRVMTNVLDVPDYEMVKADGTKVTQGSYVPIADAMNSRTWKSPPRLKIPKLTFQKLRDALVPYIDLWAALGITGLLNPDANWAGRVGSLQKNFRHTLQLNRRWTDRALSIKAYLVGTVDFFTGQRSPSQVFCDYTIIGGQRSFIKSRQGGATPKYAANVRGYPQGAITPNAHPAPARVTVEDEDQGVIRLDFTVDPSRAREQVLPGFMLNIPDEDPTFGSSFWNAVSSAGAIPSLEAAWKAAVILTMVPAGPNNNAQFHRVIVKPTDVKSMLPKAVAARLGAARGPIMEIRVGASVETARHQWPYGEKPEDVAAVEAAFGIPHVIDDTTEDGKALTKRLERLIVNRSASGNVNKGVSLESIARGYAAKVWAGEADRYVGQKTGKLAPGAYPAGNLDEVRHEIRADGAVLTSIDLPEEVPQFEMTQFLGEKERAVVFKSVR